MTFKQMVNDVITTTGVGHSIATVAGLDADSDEAKVVGFIRKAQLDVSRKLPNAALKFTGSITTLARVALHEKFGDFDADGTNDNALSVVKGSSLVSGASDHALVVDPSWVGMLCHFESDKETYRVLSVDASANTFKLADMAGLEVVYQGTTKSTTSAGVAVDNTDAYASTNTYATGWVAQDRYQLPANFKMPHNFNHFWGPGQMTYRSPDRFDGLRYEQNAVVWDVSSPSYFTIFSMELVDGEPRHLVQFWPIPKELKSYPFRYEGSPVLMSNDSDVSGYPAEYEQAILTRARYYVYRFILRDDTQVQIEVGEWADTFNDQRKNPIVAGEPPQIQPQTSREFWEDAY